MDAAAVRNCIVATLDPTADVRKQGEHELKQVRLQKRKEKHYNIPSLYIWDGQRPLRAIPLDLVESINPQLVALVADQRYNCSRLYNFRPSNNQDLSTASSPSSRANNSKMFAWEVRLAPQSPAHKPRGLIRRQETSLTDFMLA